MIHIQAFALSIQDKINILILLLLWLWTLLNLNQIIITFMVSLVYWHGLHPCQFVIKAICHVIY